jgi:hypothetical protein
LRAWFGDECENQIVTGPRTDISTIRWLRPPPSADDSLSALIQCLSDADRSVTAASWSEIATHGPRRVFRRISGDHADHLKWFGEDGISIRRRSGLSIWPTAARRHIEWMRILESLGVRIAPLIAAGELAPTRPLRQPASFIVTRSPISATTIEDAARTPALTKHQRTRLAAEILILARRLHARGIARLDLRAANVLIYSPDEPPVLFDVDRLVRVGFLNRRARIEKDMMRVRATCDMLLSGTGTTIDELNPARDQAS